MKTPFSLLIICILLFSSCREKVAKTPEFTGTDFKTSIKTCFQNKNFKALLEYKKDEKKKIRITTEFNLVDTVSVNNVICYINPRDKDVYTNPDVFYTFKVDVKNLAASQVLVTIRNDETPASFKTRFGNELSYEYKNGFWKLSKQESYIDD